MSGLFVPTHPHRLTEGVFVMFEPAAFGGVAQLYRASSRLVALLLASAGSALAQDDNVRVEVRASGVPVAGASVVIDRRRSSRTIRESWSGRRRSGPSRAPCCRPLAFPTRNRS